MNAINTNLQNVNLLSDIQNAFGTKLLKASLQNETRDAALLMEMLNASGIGNNVDIKV